MTVAANADRRSRLLALCHNLGREDRHLAILGEGNVSTRSDDGGLFIKASGHNLGALTLQGLVACRPAGLLALVDRGEASDDEIEAALYASRVDPHARKPSVETLFHAFLLGLPGVEWVGHTHSIAVNRILCSPRAREFAQRRMFPDEIVCCGEESVFLPYTDPGLRLAIGIREATDDFLRRYGAPPRVILLANHGIITLGATDSAVLAAMLMAQKAAEIWLGAAALGGPVYLAPEDVRRIAGRSDEHYRQRALNI
jgi:rhamnose utilization protein RhaD (predicted bifunctional aldolase and dehydrogenase)